MYVCCCTVQPDQINVAVLFWYLVKSDLVPETHDYVYLVTL